MILIFFFTFIFLHFSTLFYFWGFSISSFSNSITSRMPQFKDQRFHADIFPFSHISNHICGKTGGNPQVLFSHIALNCFHRPSHVILLYHPYPKGTRNHLQNSPAPAWKESAFPTVPVPAPGPPGVYPSLCFSTRTAAPLIRAKAD